MKMQSMVLGVDIDRSHSGPRKCHLRSKKTIKGDSELTVKNAASMVEIFLPDLKNSLV